MTALKPLAPARSRRPGPRPAPLEARRKPPPPRGRLVPRTRLVRRLRGASDAPLALLVAPAGYGKSTVLAQWAEQDRRPFAWLTLSEADNDQPQLLTSIASVLDVTGLVPARGGRDGMLPALLRSIESSDRAFVLVLDDVQVLTDSDSLAALSAIVDHMPRGSQLALASRREPALPVGRLRAHRKIVELRHGDMAMAPSEAGALLGGAGMTAGVDEIETLRRSTEGWAAGLYLAALSLRERQNRGGRAESFSGADRMVADYVRDEILPELSPDQVTFLTRASVLERLSGPACDEVLGRSGSARVLDGLARRNLMLLPSEDGSGYRLHGLIAQTLRAELRRSEPDLQRELHRRAASWHAVRGDVDSAARHAVAARDAGLAGKILWANILGYVTHGRNGVIQRWLDAFTDEEIATHAGLSLVAACSWLVQGDRNRAEHWTDAAEHGLGETGQRGLTPSLAAGVAVLRACIAADGIARMHQDAARAYDVLPERSPWRANCCLLQGVASHLTGDPERARAHLEEGARRAAVTAPSTQALCLAQLALLAVDEEDRAGGEALAARARAQVERFGLSDSAGSALVYAVSASMRAHRGRIDEAAMDQRRASDLLAQLCDVAPWYEVEVRIALARTALRLSDVAGARALLSGVSRLLRSMPRPTALHRWHDEVWTQAESANGRGAGDPWSLTTAELRVLQFLPTHLSFPEVAARLNVSANTVKTHARAIYRKLDASSRAETVVRARAAGLVEM